MVNLTPSPKSSLPWALNCSHFASILFDSTKSLKAEQYVSATLCMIPVDHLIVISTRNHQPSSTPANNTLQNIVNVDEGLKHSDGP